MEKRATSGELPGMDGVARLQCLRMQELSVPAIVMMGKPSAFVRQQALAAGAIAFLEKPLDAGQIVSLVREGKAAASQETLQLGNALVVAPALTVIERQFGARPLTGMVERPVLLIACP
ncbi:response regulator [Reyranella sp.]|uniref:response regulator n=1 Tax=Reyranella sp. TaxID=1929291 RepID=UPI003C7C0E1A